MATDLTFYKGQQAVFRFFFDGTEVVLNSKSWAVKVNVTKIADGVNGEDRDRLDRVTNYFEITADCFQRDVKILQAMLADIANDDQTVPPLDKGGGVRIKLYDGSRKAFVCKEVVWDDFDFGATARADRAMIKVSWRCRYFDEVRSVI